jgi:nucleotide-binding universal stress UspA family protein
MFRTLLVPTDLSSNAACAVVYAVRLARAVGAARITFFHANERYLPTSTPVRLYHELTENMIREDRRTLAEEPEPVDAAQIASWLRERIPYPASLLLKPLLPGEDAGKLLQAVVQEQQASLLVMFARHKNWLERLTGRSNTGEAFYGSRVPVLALRSS